MGKDYPGTVLPRTFEERLDAFRASEPLRMCSQRRNVYEFGKYFRLDDRLSEVRSGSEGGPDFDNAVSTLVVRARPSKQAGAPKYWLRRVCVITLAEVLFHFKNNATQWEELYNMWLEGAVVIRKRGPRGRRANDPATKRRRLQDGSQWRQEGSQWRQGWRGKWVRVA